MSDIKKGNSNFSSNCKADFKSNFSSDCVPDKKNGVADIKCAQGVANINAAQDGTNIKCAQGGANTNAAQGVANIKVTQGGVRNRYVLTCPVFFVGFMGAGKTTITRKLAHKYGLASLDMDIYIEQQENIRIRKVFSEFGEEKFREAETRVLAELSNKKPLLISCGGGVVSAQASLDILKSNFVVFLKTTAQQSKDRISNLRSRPLFKELSAAQKLNESREPLYRSVANVEIDTEDKPASVIVREVAAALMRCDVLVQR